MLVSYNFEVHITIECNDIETRNRFKDTCDFIRAKMIEVNLLTSKQVMTSKTFIGYDYKQLCSLVDSDISAIKKDFNILRIKVESCPKYVKETDTKYNYFEIHVPCHGDKIIDFDLQRLSRKWHRSFNEFKENVIMLTCRSTVDREISLIDKDIEKLKSLGLVCDNFKHHYEYAIIDTNINLDKGWIS